MVCVKFSVYPGKFGIQSSHHYQMSNFRLLAISMQFIDTVSLNMIPVVGQG